MINRSQTYDDRAARVRSSMLWGAWADALGFISEMTTASNLKRRTRGRPLNKPFAWSRQIGGRTGVRAELPAGTYSDDTQLRLCTSRSISGNGFDVEAFAKVELSVWPSYALGGGRASRAAAASIGKQQSTWATNFFDGWQNSGGNGAAMRIQPHVYSASEFSSGDYLDDVIRNAVVTHGHPRGIAGAVLHAASLGFTLESRRVPNSSDWSDLLALVASAVKAFERVPELEAYWLPRWEATTKSDFGSAWYTTIQELDDMLNAVEPSLTHLVEGSGDKIRVVAAYGDLIDVLNLTAPENRGSATATAVAALTLAGGLSEHPAQAAQIAASVLDTDTDTIATMACSLAGAAVPCPLTSPVQDADYLMAEADRLTQISFGESVPGFPYPDLLKWKAPKSALDCVGLVDGEPELAGLGRLEPLPGERGAELQSKDAVWRWVATTFGASMLVKLRAMPRDLPVGNVSRPIEGGPKIPAQAAKPDAEPLLLADPSLPDNSGSLRALDLREVKEWLYGKGLNDVSLGYALRRVIENGNPGQLKDFVDFVRAEIQRQGR